MDAGREISGLGTPSAAGWPEKGQGRMTARPLSSRFAAAVLAAGLTADSPAGGKPGIPGAVGRRREPGARFREASKCWGTVRPVPADP